MVPQNHTTTVLILQAELCSRTMTEKAFFLDIHRCDRKLPVSRANPKYALQCGLPAVKPHDFRRFVGTQLAKRDLRQAQRALGHKRLETTVQHYVLDELQPGLTEGLY